MDGGAWLAVVHGVTKSRTRLSDFTLTFHFHALEKEMATHSTVLAWRIPGMGNLVAAIYGVTQSRTRLKWLSSSRTFHSKTMNFIFFSSAHRTSSQIDYILSHKSSLGKLKKIEIISSIFSDHNEVRLEINYRKKKKTMKNTNIWRLNNTLLNN